MSDQHSQKNGQSVFRLERGGLDFRGRRRSMIRTAKEIELDDRMRRRFLTLSGSSSRAIQEIREGRQAPWRANARRALELHADGVPAPEIKAVLIGEFVRWIDELDQPLKPAA